MIADPIQSVLLVEDNPGDARLLREMLNERGGRPPALTLVDRMESAEEHLAVHPVDIILLDLALPDTEGMNAVRRAHAAAPRVPLVVLTGLDDEAIAAQALKEGAQDYLIKGEIETRGLRRALRYAVERKAMEEALFVEKERAQVTLKSIGDAVASTDLGGNITFLNLAAERMTGWSLDEAMGRPMAEVLRLTFGKGRSFLLPSTATLVRRDGVEIGIENTIATIHDREGEPTGAVVVLRDVTDRRQAEREMRKSDERFRRLFDANTIGITITALSGRTLEANDAYLDMLGYSREELLGADFPWDELTPPEYAELDRIALSQLHRSGVAQPVEKEFVCRDGSRVPVLVGLAMLDASEGGCISYVVNLTTRRHLEDQLRQAQKMEAIGQLAGGVAHDFNNLLTVILGHSGLLEAQLSDPGPLRESVDEIKRAGDRAASLTRQLLAFSRRQVLDPKVLDLNALVQNVEKMLRRMIGEDVVLVTTPAPTVAHVRADAGQVEQVLMNLALNARDAMPAGGSLTIEMGNVELDAAYALEHPAVEAGTYVMLAVSDTGTGMTADTQRHMFEPFYTTKGRDRGSGLGLATVYGIVKQSGGDIWVYSELGHGTTIKVFLPRVDADVDADVGGRSPAVAPPRATETVLLAEDDPAVRLLVSNLLEERGYRVLAASSGLEALAVAKKHSGPIDLLLTDVVMPQMGGSDLAAHLKTTRPETRVVFMSGYPDDAIVRQGHLAEGVRFIQKPFTPEGLASKLREALA